jgi:predicted DNA-binding transcriptional regulator YafY
MSADEQLQRLLQALPVIAQQPELSLHELAGRIGSDAATLRKDFSALDRDDVPAAWVEAVVVYLGPQSVSMRSAHFKRPMRLTRPELAALELGLSMLSQELPADEQHRTSAVRDKLRQVTTKPVETAVDRRRGDAFVRARTSGHAASGAGCAAGGAADVPASRRRRANGAPRFSVRPAAR